MTLPPLSSNVNRTERNPPSPPSSSSHGINNTFLRRWTLLTVLETLGRVRPYAGSVLLLTENLCVKRGPIVQLSEASALRYVGRYTSIPVPKVHCAFVHKDSTYILMDRIHGKTLLCDWATRSLESKGKILAQLKRMVDELRLLPAPGPRVTNVDGGPLYDCRFPITSTIGPFDTIHDFHLLLRNGVEAGPRMPPDVNRMIALQDRPWPMPAFTHGDLSSQNILARGDDVVGIVDWETSGWYPSYWEFSMAWYVHPWNVLWKEEVGKFLDATPEEMEMERIRLTYFGDI